MYVPDNYDMFVEYQAEQDRKLSKLPECSVCFEPIQDEHCYLINDELICPDCMDDNYRVCTENFVE